MNKNENGITLIMLTTTIVVMLIIAVTLTYYSVGDSSLIKNAQDTKFKETMSDLKTKVEEKIVIKQEFAGNKNVTLSESEQSEILGEYYPDKLIVKNQKICYKKGSNFSKSEKEILSSIGFEEIDD